MIMMWKNKMHKMRIKEILKIYKVNRTLHSIQLHARKEKSAMMSFTTWSIDYNKNKRFKLAKDS